MNDFKYYLWNVFQTRGVGLAHACLTLGTAEQMGVICASSWSYVHVCAKASVSCFFHNMIYLFFRYRSNKFRSYYSLKRLGNRLYKKILKFYHIVNFWKQDLQYNNSCHVVNFISTDIQWIWQFHNQKYITYEWKIHNISEGYAQQCNAWQQYAQKGTLWQFSLTKRKS